MTKMLRSSLLALMAIVLAVVPAFAQEQEDLKNYAGVYEFEAPDYGVISVVVTLTDEGGLTLSAMNTTTPLKHLSGKSYEMNSPDFGVINVGFIEEDDGTISSMSIDAYDFSFVAVKKQ